MITIDPVYDQVLLMNMNSYRWAEFVAFSGKGRHRNNGLEGRYKVVDVPIRLIDRPGFGRVPPDVVEVG